MIKKKNMIAIGVGLVMGLFPMNVHAGETDIQRVQNEKEVIVEEINESKTDVEINEENFPDPVFRQFVLENYGDGGQVLTPEMIEEITYINCSELGIKSLEGIEFFTEMGYLNCSYNEISDLDISQNPELWSLNCSCNEISDLDVSQNPKLSELDCSSNEISDLDVSHNPELSELICSYNELSSLDVSQNLELSDLACSSNELSDLDVSHNLKLRYLSCYDNKLSNLDVSQNPELSDLYCFAIELSDLDVSHNPKLRCLSCYDNKLSNLDVSQNPELSELICFSNELSNLDVSHNPKLSRLSCDSNNLSSLDVSQNSELSGLNCSYNEISNLDVRQNSELSELNCFYNELSNLDVSHNPKLSRLDCGSNKLSSLDVSQNPKLSYLSCTNNQLGCLDLSNNLDVSVDEDIYSQIEIDSNQIDMFQYDDKFDSSKVSELQNLQLNGNVFTFISGKEGTYNYDCSNGVTMEVTIEIKMPDVEINEENFPDPVFRQFVLDKYGDEEQVLTAERIEIITNISCSGLGIKSLEGIEFFTELSDLYCSYNELSELDVSNNQKLESLNCECNKLSSLDVSKNPELGTLYCSSNELSGLDVSNNPYLMMFGCNDNRLSELDVSNNSCLVDLTCSNNKISSLDVRNNPNLQKLMCANNMLSCLDVNNQAELYLFSCENNKLNGLDLSNNSKLGVVFCSNNQLGCLDFSNNLDVSVQGGLFSQIRINGEQIDMFQYDNKFDSSKVSGLQNLQLNGNVFTLMGNKKGSYNYDCGNGITMEVIVTNQPDVEINEENFPDDIFRDYILTGIDADKNLTLSESEIQKVTKIALNVYDITSFKGIEFFTNLKEFECGANSLKSLDLSANTKLESLDCRSNSLEKLDLSNNTALTRLLCSTNPMMNLNVKANAKLEELDCTDTQLVCLEVSPDAQVTTWGATGKRTIPYGKLDISNIGDFDKNRLSNMENIILTETGLELVDKTKAGSYIYNCGNGCFLNVTLQSDGKTEGKEKEDVDDIGSYKRWLEADSDNVTAGRTIRINTLVDIIYDEEKYENYGDMDHLPYSSVGTYTLIGNTSENTKIVDTYWSFFEPFYVQIGEDETAEEITVCVRLHNYRFFLKDKETGEIIRVEGSDFGKEVAATFKVLPADEQGEVKAALQGTFKPAKVSLKPGENMEIDVENVFIYDNERFSLQNDANHTVRRDIKNCTITGNTSENTKIENPSYNKYILYVAPEEEAEELKITMETGYWAYFLKDNATGGVFRVKGNDFGTIEGVVKIGKKVVEKDWSFADVDAQPGTWKYDNIKYVYDRNIMNGISGTNNFDPDGTLNRAMFATVLYRMAGSPEIEFADKFTDVQVGKYYSSAVIWANQKGIVNGFSDGSYGVNTNITREQIAKMLYEYASKTGYDVSGTAAIDTFTDKESVSGWAVGYMKWAVDAGMISGKPNGDGTFRLDPKGEATRAECAKMLTMFLKKYCPE